MVKILLFVQEKWRIAIDRPGSGNTKNIGSVSSIEDLINGNGTFAGLGENVFDDYWINYLTPDMAKKRNSQIRITITWRVIRNSEIYNKCNSHHYFLNLRFSAGTNSHLRGIKAVKLNLLIGFGMKCQVFRFIQP